MQLALNGESVEVQTNSLTELLTLQGVNDKRVAVVINNHPIAAAERESVVLKPGDRIELITFAGGG